MPYQLSSWRHWLLHVSVSCWQQWSIKQLALMIFFLMALCCDSLRWVLCTPTVICLHVHLAAHISRLPAHLSSHAMAVLYLSYFSCGSMGGDRNHVLKFFPFLFKSVNAQQVGVLAYVPPFLSYRFKSILAGCGLHICTQI